jgi:hypothetical protein
MRKRDLLTALKMAKRLSKAFPCAKRENYIETVMKRMAEYGAEAVLSYEEEQRIRRAECLIEGE